MAGQPGPADPYRVLGVPADATREEIVRAYRQLARGSHPDLRRGDPAAADQFQAVTDAYQLLGDPRRRLRYDRAHPGDAPGPEQGGGGRPSGGPPSGGPDRPRPGPPPIWAGPVHVDPPAGPPGPPPRWPWPGQQEPGAAGVLWLLWSRASQDDGPWWP